MEWESWEQHCLWNILIAHNFTAEDYLPVIPTLDYRNHSEALTSLLLILCKERSVHVHFETKNVQILYRLN